MMMKNTVIASAFALTATAVSTTETLPLDSGNSWTHLFSYHIQMEEADLKFLQDDPRAEIYKPCNVTVYYGGELNEEKKVLKSVGAGCRYKGASGSFFGCVGTDGKQNKTSDWCRNLSWKINARKFASNYPGLPKQPRFDGQDKVAFQGMQGDTTLMGELSSWHHMTDVGGTPAARCNQANVYVNNLYEGLYNHLENIDEEFVEARWGKTGVENGALLKHTWFRPESSSAQVKFASSSGFTGAEILKTIRADAVQCQKERKGCTVERAKEILQKLDRDSFIRGFMIAELTHNYDTAPYAFFASYVDESNNQPYNELTVNNFFMYAEEATEKVVFIPWDYTEGLTHDACASGLCEVGLFGNVSVYDNYNYTGDLQEDLPADLCKAKMDIFPEVKEEKDKLYLSYPACEPVLYTMGKAWGDEYRAALKQFVDGLGDRQAAFAKNLYKEQQPYVRKYAFDNEYNLPQFDDWVWAYNNDESCVDSYPDGSPCNRGFEDRMSRISDAIYQLHGLDGVNASTEAKPQTFLPVSKTSGKTGLEDGETGETGTGAGTSTGGTGGSGSSFGVSVAVIMMSFGVWNFLI